MLPASNCGVSLDIQQPGIRLQRCLSGFIPQILNGSIQDDPLPQRMKRVITQVLQVSISASQESPAIEQQEASEQMAEQFRVRGPFGPQEKVDEQQALEPLFALMAQLHKHPEFIAVARDFIRELTPGV